MTFDWTPAVTRALAAANVWAQHLGAAEVEPRHLLLGLLNEEEGRAAMLLQRQGLLLQAVREKLSDGTPLPSSFPTLSPIDEKTLSMGPQAERLLTVARWLAVDLSGETSVASEHVLMAVLQEESSVRQALEPLGLNFDQLQKQLQSQQKPITLDEPLELSPSTEQIDMARVLDANANRAREALRVIEDYCRFVLDDEFLSQELKNLRHELAALLAEFPVSLLLEARDTEHDVGTSLSTPSEQLRFSLLNVVQANLKRLQESLRCLEEYGKLRSAAAGLGLESLRYRTYTLERAILLGTTARQRLAEACLYVIVSGSACTASIDWTIKEAVAGGAQIIQLREKSLNDRQLLERAHKVRAWTQQVGALFIMNDRPDIVRLVEADGVHLGQDELSVKDARRIIGPDALIGVSTHNIEQVRQAILDGASYIGVGPTFQSGTKDFEELAGLEFIRQVAGETTIPAFAIGGITLENVEQVLAAGIWRIAVGQAICTADDPRKAAMGLRTALRA